MHNYNRIIYQIQTELDSLFMMLDLQRSVNMIVFSVLNHIPNILLTKDEEAK